MTLYDTIEQHISRASEEDMLDILECISKYVEDMRYYDEPLTESMIKDVHARLYGKHYTKRLAEDQISSMSYVKDDIDTVSAPYWSQAEVNEQYERAKDFIPGIYTKWDFFVTINYIMTQYHSALDQWFKDDKLTKVTELAVSFLSDPETDSKIWDTLS